MLDQSDQQMQFKMAEARKVMGTRSQQEVQQMGQMEQLRKKLADQQIEVGGVYRGVQKYQIIVGKKLTNV